MNSIMTAQELSQFYGVIFESVEVTKMTCVVNDGRRFEREIRDGAEAKGALYCFNIVSRWYDPHDSGTTVTLNFAIKGKNSDEATISVSVKRRESWQLEFYNLFAGDLAGYAPRVEELLVC